MKRKYAGIAVAVVAVLAGVIIVWQGAYIVRPDQFALVLEFGEVVADKREPGLYFKVPFVQDVKYLDRRVRGWDDDGKDVKTKELKPIDFRAFARWRIVDPQKFYERVRDEKRAHASMDSIVTAQIQATVRESKLGELVRNSDRDFGKQEELDLQNLIARFDECNPASHCVDAGSSWIPLRPDGSPVEADCADTCTEGYVCVPGNDEILKQMREKRYAASRDIKEKAKRATIVNNILKAANLMLREEFGLEILDLHFKYLNLAQAVHVDVIERIRADREADIAAYERVGLACKGSIQRGKEQRLGHIVGERDRRVLDEKGRAVAREIDIKFQAFNEDPEIFQFMKTLELYEAGLARGTKLVLSADHPILTLMGDHKLLSPVAKKLVTTQPKKTEPPKKVVPTKVVPKKVEEPEKVAPPKGDAPKPITPPKKVDTPKEGAPKPPKP